MSDFLKAVLIVLVMGGPSVGLAYLDYDAETVKTMNQQRKAAQANCLLVYIGASDGGGGIVTDEEPLTIRVKPNEGFDGDFAAREKDLFPLAEEGSPASAFDRITVARIIRESLSNPAPFGTMSEKINFENSYECLTHLSLHDSGWAEYQFYVDTLITEFRHSGEPEISDRLTDFYHLIGIVRQGIR